MSNIVYNTIDITFPVAGQDNNSQGFRDNFAATALALSTAKTEITALQDNGVDTSLLTNNLNGTVLSNGSYNQFYGQFYNVTNNSGITGAVDIDIRQGAMQKVVLAGDGTLHFTNWPSTSNTYAVVRVMVISAEPSTHVLSFTTVAGSIRLATGLTSPITVLSSKYQIIEAWTVDSGAHVQVRVVGEF